MSIQNKVVIDSKYNGPANSGNGGYVAGLLASYTPFSCPEVMLLKPPPLNEQLELHENEGEWILKSETRIIAKAKESNFDLEVPVKPSMADAVLCESRYPGFDRHVFPECFVCGPQRGEHDGLRLFTGISGTEDYVAAPFRTFDALYDDQGILKTEIIWAALDCPGAYAITQIAEEKMMVLGKLSVKLVNPVDREEKLIVAGWYKGADGKKNYAGTALYNSDGDVKAIGNAIWIEVDPKQFNK